MIEKDTIVVFTARSPGRIIEIGDAARISVPEVWKHWRNPVRYVSLSELGIGVDDLEFEQLPGGKEEAQSSKRQGQTTAPWPPTTLTIAEAKKALAATFGVKPDAAIRG